MNFFVVLCILLGPIHCLKGVSIERVEGSFTFPLKNVREIGDYIRQHTSSDGTLLTSETYLAVQANRNVISGLEMSVFSYFPSWSFEKCTEYHVVNNEILYQSIASK